MYNKKDWYWRVTEREDVYASARNLFVQENDATFQAWTATGKTPTRILNVVELADVLGIAPSAVGGGSVVWEKQAHNAPILAALTALDTAAIRPLRAIQAAIASNQEPSQADKNRLSEIEAQAAALRAQLQE